MSVIYKALKKIKNQQYEQKHNPDNKIQIKNKKNIDIKILSITKIITTFIACLAIISVFSLLLIEYLNTVKLNKFKQKKIYANILKKQNNHKNNNLSIIKEEKNNQIAKIERTKAEEANSEITNNEMTKNNTEDIIIAKNEIDKNEISNNEIMNTNIGSLENTVTFIPANTDIKNSSLDIKNKENQIIQNVDDIPKNVKQIIYQNNKKNVSQNNTKKNKDKETTYNSSQKIISKKNQIINTDFKINPDKKNIVNKPKFLNLFNKKESHKTNSLPKKQKKFKNIKPTKEKDKDKTKIISEKNQIKSLDKSKSQINSTVSKIVQQVRTNIIKNNHAKVNKYLKQLENIKGENNIFVLKLKAFWHIKTGEYNIAEKLLQDVLNRNKDDFEAGINMAVIDINQNRISQARERLHNLQQVYPENSKILNIIKALN